VLEGHTRGLTVIQGVVRDKVQPGERRGCCGLSVLAAVHACLGCAPVTQHCAALKRFETATCFTKAYRREQKKEIQGKERAVYSDERKV
jgi:hypothetical protein